MKDFNKYFIVGTNSDALHDTMNGSVVGELIRCKDCFWYRSVELKADGTHDKRFKPSRCALWDEDMNDTDFCSYAMPKEADE